MKALCALLLSASVWSADPVYVQVISPLSVQEAIKWDSYVEMIPLRDIGVLLDTRTVRNTAQILHSYVVVTANEKPYILVTYLRPRSNLQQALTEQQQVEDAERKFRERAEKSKP